MSEARTIRPGFLVSMKTSITGNVQTEREILQAQHEDEAGHLVSEVNIKHTVIDPAEHAEAVKLRGKIRAQVTGLCTASNFGLLCPSSKETELLEAFAKGRDMAWDFNRAATTTTINFNVIYGRIAQDDYEAVQAISQELRGLMADMEDGIKNLDLKKVRDAAQKANDTGQMLSVDAKLRVDEAVKAARKAARKISKAGEAAAVEISTEALKTLAGARTAFLDIDMDDEVGNGTGPDDTEAAIQAAAAPAAEFDFSSWDDEPVENQLVREELGALMNAPQNGPEIDYNLDTEEN